MQIFLRLTPKKRHGRGVVVRAVKVYPQASALRLCSPGPLALPLRCAGSEIPLLLDKLPPRSPRGVRHVPCRCLQRTSKANAKGDDTMTTAITTIENQRKPNPRQTAKEIIAANVLSPHPATGGRTQATH